MNLKTIKLPIIKSGRALKKRLRQSVRYFKFGTKSYPKSISLPETKFQIFINPSKNACVDEIIATQGNWEPKITERLATFVKPNMVFLDIGSNIGYYSLFVSSLLKNTGEVYAFEPITSLFNQINESIKLNGFTNIKALQTALGNEKAEKEIYLRDENMGGSSLIDYKDLNIVRVSSIEKIMVDKLDSVLPKNTKVDLIKIDVEGYELEALQGAKKILEAQHPVIFMEFSPVFYEQDRKGKTQEMITFLEELNYTCQTIAGEPLYLKKWVEKTTNPTQIDIICTN